MTTQPFSFDLEKKGTGIFDGWSLRHFVLLSGSGHQFGMFNPKLQYYIPGSTELKGEFHLWRHTRCVEGDGTLFELQGCKGSKRAGADDVVKLRAASVEQRKECITAIEQALAQYTSFANFTGVTRIRDLAFANNLVDHRRYHFKRYDDCLIASELVTALVQHDVTNSRVAAVELCQELVRHDALHHVCDDHPFEDSDNFYRFSVDDELESRHTRDPTVTPFHHSRDLPDSVSSNLTQLLSLVDRFELVEDRWYHLLRYSDCLVASELVDTIVAQGIANSRETATDMCQELVVHDALHHVCDDHPFEDCGNFYRFTAHESESEQLKRRKAPPPLVLQNLRFAVEEAADLEDKDIQTVIDLMEQTPHDDPEPEVVISRTKPKKKKKKKKTKKKKEEQQQHALTEAAAAGDCKDWLQVLDSLRNNRNVQAGAVVAFAILVLVGVSTELLLLLLGIGSLVLYTEYEASTRRLRQKQKDLLQAQRNQNSLQKANKTVELSEESSEEEEIQAPVLPEKNCVENSGQWTAPAAGSVHRGQIVKVFVFGAGGATQLIPVDTNVDTVPVTISGPSFEGRMVVRVLGLLPKTKYFDGKSRKFSIQVEGRFTEDVCVEDLEFGAVFDHPIKLPWGSSIGLSLAHKIDRALKEDLEGPKPWLMSPLLCGMNRWKASAAAVTGELGPWQYGGAAHLEEDSGAILPPAEQSRGQSEGKRRRFFEDPKNRRTTTLRAGQIHEMEFLSSLVDFRTFEVSLGIRKSVLPYLNGQPVRFEARLKGKVLFGVVFDGRAIA